MKPQQADGYIFPSWMDRTVQLLGPGKTNRLRTSKVLIAGLGGVGSMAAESLVRAGIGELMIVDCDHIQSSNINRQIPALHSTIGKAKALVMKERLLDINPELKIESREIYLKEDTIEGLFTDTYDFVVDAIDTLTPKILLIEKVVKLGLPLASSMGSGGKVDPGQIRISDFKKTYNCRLAYILRKKLRKMGINGGFKVVFSTELVDKDRVLIAENEPNKKSTLGTISYIPAIFGCMLSSIVVDGIIAAGPSD